MEDQLIEILSGCGYPVYKQGSMSNDSDYPETFITFWNNNAPDHSHYDDDAYGTEWDYNIYVYSSDPEKVYSTMEEIRLALKAARWICLGKGFDVQSDEESHTGRGLEIIFMQFG